MLEIADKVGRFFENLLLAVLLLGMIGLSTTQIVLRDFGMGSLVWGDEAVRLMVLWVAMVAGVAAAREDRHISIDVLSRFLPVKFGAVVQFVVDLFTAAVCFALAWYSWRMVGLAVEYDEVLLGGRPAWIFQSILPAGFFLMGWRYLIWMTRRVRTLLQRGSD